MPEDPVATPGWPTAIVLACDGAAEGPLNVVRALGAAAVPVALVCESAETPAASSRHVRRVVVARRFTSDPGALVDAVRSIAAASAGRPIVFPTADPDLMLVSRTRDALDAVCEVSTPPSDLVAQLSDKRRFDALARRHSLPVPATHAPASLEELRGACAAARFPVIVKPSHPKAWHAPALEEVVGGAKGIRVDSAGAMLELGTAIGKVNFDYLVQELVPGPDEEHFDVHAYLDRAGTPLAHFSGQKLRIFPPHAGSGCFVRSVEQPELVELALQVLRAVRFTGIANMNFKRDPASGKFWLLEINPRVSQWNILASRCGINLPEIAYRDLAGLGAARPAPQQNGVYYLNFANDLAAVRIYRKEGLLTWGRYARSLLLRPRIDQWWDAHDPAPFLRAFRKRLGAWSSRFRRARQG
jgi:predicted ATP-grasp superfamily ATP-dependent carboligase